MNRKRGIPPFTLLMRVRFSSFRKTDNTCRQLLASMQPFETIIFFPNRRARGFFYFLKPKKQSRGNVRARSAVPKRFFAPRNLSFLLT